MGELLELDVFLVSGAGGPEEEEVCVVYSFVLEGQGAPAETQSQCQNDRDVLLPDALQVEQNG